MNPLISRLRIPVLCAALAIAGCNSNSAPSATGSKGAADALRGSVKVHGSSTVHPISEAVAEEFSVEHPRVKITVGQAGTGGGLKKFWQGEIDICNASRRIKESEAESCAQNGIEFIELSVAFDGLAVVTNPGNDWCDCLTVEQLKKIWEPESKVTNWSDVDSSWPAKPIKLYGPGTDSGTFDYFTKAICGAERASRADYTASENDNVLVTGVQSDKYALCYFGFAYYDENRARLKLMAVDPGDGNCVQPSPETVRANTYQPLSRPLFIYVSKASLKRPEIQKFVEFYLASAPALATDVGYVPVSDEVAAQNSEILSSALSGG